MWGRMCPITRLSQVTANATPPPPSSAPHCPRASTGATAQDFNSITAYDMCPSRRERCPLTIDIMRPYMGFVGVKAMHCNVGTRNPAFACMYTCRLQQVQRLKILIQMRMDMSILEKHCKNCEGCPPSQMCDVNVLIKSEVMSQQSTQLHSSTQSYNTSRLKLKT